MGKRRKGQRRKEERKKPLPATYARAERRSGKGTRGDKDRRTAAEKSRQRHATAQVRSLIYLVVILAAFWGGLRYWTSSPAHVKASEELTESFQNSGVELIVVEGRGVCVYLEPQYKGTFEKAETEPAELLHDIAEEYGALTGKQSVTLYIYIEGKLARKVKL